MKIGYARVSTDDQNLAMQLDALRAAGCEKIHEDKASGVLNGRKWLSEALKSCASGGVETRPAGPVPSRSGRDRGGPEEPERGSENPDGRGGGCRYDAPARPDGLRHSGGHG